MLHFWICYIPQPTHMRHTRNTDTHTHTSKVAENVAQEQEREPIVRCMWSKNALQSASSLISYRHQETERMPRRRRRALPARNTQIQLGEMVTQATSRMPVAGLSLGWMVEPVQKGNNGVGGAYFLPPCSGPLPVYTCKQSSASGYSASFLLSGIWRL